MIHEVVLLGEKQVGVDLANRIVLDSTPVLTGRRGPEGPKGDPGDSGAPGAGSVVSVNNRVGEVTGLAELTDLEDFVTDSEIEQLLDGYAPDSAVAAVAADLTQVEVLLPTLATKGELADVEALIPDVSDFLRETDLTPVIELIPQPGDYATPTELTAAFTAARDRDNHTGTQTSDTISDFAAAVMAKISEILGMPLGVATLDADGKLYVDQIPAIALVDTFVRSSEAEMLALGSVGAEQGDVCVRMDLSKSFILKSGSASVLSNWAELLTPASPVSSVNGRVGPVSGLAEQSALDAVSSSLTAHTTNYGNPHLTTTSQVSEDSPYKRYTNDGDVARLSNTYGVNTGDQDLSTYARGPATAVDNALVRFDTTTGKLLQVSGVIVDDNGWIRTGTVNALGGTTGAVFAAPAGRAARGIVLQQTLAAGTLNAFEIQRSDGGTTAWFDSLGSLRFQGNTDQGVVVTTNGATKASSNAKVQFQAANAASTAMALFGFGTQTADFFRILTDAGILLFAVGADGKLLWGPNGAQDVNLYRGGNNILATDDAFSAAGPVTGSNLSGTNTGDETLARLLTLLATDIGMMRVVRHGATAATPRPTWAGPVYWDGSIYPTNIDLTKGDKYISST